MGECGSHPQTQVKLLLSIRMKLGKEQIVSPSAWQGQERAAS